MSKRDGLPEFPGWRSLDDDEPLPPSFRWVNVDPKSPSFRGGLNDNPEVRPPGSEGFYDRTIRELHITAVGRCWWAYIRAALVTYNGMPSGITPPPGWIALPDSEPIKRGDRWFYVSGSRGDMAGDGCCGHTPLSWKAHQGIRSYSGWPFRLNARFGQESAGPAVRRFPPHPYYSRELPLP